MSKVNLFKQCFIAQTSVSRSDVHKKKFYNQTLEILHINQSMEFIKAYVILNLNIVIKTVNNILSSISIKCSLTMTVLNGFNLLHIQINLAVVFWTFHSLVVYDLLKLKKSELLSNLT